MLARYPARAIREQFLLPDWNGLFYTVDDKFTCFKCCFPVPCPDQYAYNRVFYVKTPYRCIISTDLISNRSMASCGYVQVPSPPLLLSLKLNTPDTIIPDRTKKLTIAPISGGLLPVLVLQYQRSHELHVYT